MDAAINTTLTAAYAYAFASVQRVHAGFSKSRS